MLSGRVARSVTVALLLITLALGVVTLNVAIEGERALARSDAAFHRGEVEEALAHALRAAMLYAPGAPHRGAAYERMAAIAVGSERQGNTGLALRAWRAIRGAALETRHVWHTEPKWLELANDNLARLQAQGLTQEVQHADRQAAQQEILGSLQREETPRAGWVIVLGLGLLLTAAGLAWGIFSAVTREGLVAWERLKGPGAVAVIGLVCWMLAVIRA
jgi:hypothetical protein